MDGCQMKPIDQIFNCIKKQQNFVLQGGAGSGKTETLKQSLEFISKQYPNKKVACITHTNLAADEIASRVDGDYSISTIHSFLNSLINSYKKDIHKVIYEIFKLEIVQRKNLEDFDNDSKELRKAEHENYKKLYDKYAKKLFALKNESIEKVVGKRDYDKDPDGYNEKLNCKIDELNLDIKSSIDEKDYYQPGYNEYNETKFDGLKDLTYGHDGLLKVSSLLFSRYPLIGRILQDKFDYIFIDEFQDTHSDIIDIFLNKLPNNTKTTIGLFGDSMQGIYGDGIGNVNNYIQKKALHEIKKNDNYRCSDQVRKFLNYQRIPIDGLEQQLALKKINGEPESIDERQGFVKVFYAVYPEGRPNRNSKYEKKKSYLQVLMKLIENIESENCGFKKLMLTNKVISEKLGFANLFSVFNDRYSEVSNEIEKCLEKLQLLELARLCIAYEEGEYNFIISELNKSVFKVNSIADKQRIKELFDNLLENGLSAVDAISTAMEKNLISRSESYEWYLKDKDQFSHDLAQDNKFQRFKPIYLNDGRTFNKFEKLAPDFFGSEDEHTGRVARYDALERLLKKERFYNDLFSSKVTFKEIVNFCNYLNEKSDYITMHKTKGSGIDNVMVVLDDFFWSEYQFQTLFESQCNKLEMKLKVQKLFYVACSRAKKNLICARLITQDEEESFKNYFSQDIHINRIDFQELE